MREELDDQQVRRIRRRVRRRLDAMREIATYVVVVGCLGALDGATGGGWWVQWLALIWGVLLILRFAGVAGEMIFGEDLEERMVERELERQRRRGS